MAMQEKITLNLNVVDLGKADLLVEQGFYANRADFLRAAVRTELGLHEATLARLTNVDQLLVGVTHLSRAHLDAVVAGKQRLCLRVVGLLVIDHDVDPALADRAIESLWVRGVVRAAPPVRAVLEDRSI